MLLNIASHKGEKSGGRIRQKNEEIILAAAEVEFAAHGFKGATMNSIALHAGLPKSNIHYYFKNKLKLYAEVLANIIDLWDSALNELKSDDDPAEALTIYLATKMRYARENPLASRIFAKEILSGGPRLDDYFNDEYRRWFKTRTQVFKDWAAQGKIDNIDPAHIIFLLWSSTQHYSDFTLQISAAMNKTELDAKDFDKATQSLTRIVLQGIGVKSL